MAQNTSATALDLSDDLRNIRKYTEQGRPALVAELVYAAEEKLAQIAAHLAEVKASVGLRGPVVMLHAVREG